MKAKGKHIVTETFSAVAAQLLGDAGAAHLDFQIPIAKDHASARNISADSSLADNLQRTDLIIWHEIVISYRHNL